jgi:hypothetical protein
MKHVKHLPEAVLAFSWSRARYLLDGDRFVIDELGPSPIPSEAPLIPGFWMRAARVRQDVRAWRSFACLYGLLRREGEGTADWWALMLLLAEVAKPWGPAARGQSQLPPPSPGEPLLRARLAAKELGRQALDCGDLLPEASTEGLVFRPVTLAGMIAMQAIHAVLALPGYRRCRWCGDWYEPARTDQSFCIPRHRFNAHYDERKANK